MRIACCIPKNTPPPPHLKYLTPRTFPRQSGYANLPQVYVTVELPLLLVLVPYLYFILLLIVLVFLLMTLKKSLFDFPVIVMRKRQGSCSHIEYCSVYLF